MTTTRQSPVTTIQIRRGVRTALSISYDYTSLEATIPDSRKLQSLIDQATKQWWDSLTHFQRFGPNARPLSLKISVSYLE